MGLLSEIEFKEKINTSLDNRVLVRLDTTFKIQPDIRTFPLYCNYCGKIQPILYVHYGSRYGQVGSCNCEFCQKVIDVTDGDNIVTSIKTGGREIQFNELYLLDWNYIAVLGDDKAKMVEDALSQYQNEYITVTQLCSVVGDVLGIKDYPIKKYTTDRHYSILPQDINRWISLLDAIGVTLPDYVCVKVDENIDIERKPAERKPTDEERKYLLRKSIPWIVVGMLIAVLFGIQAIMTLVEYVSIGSMVRGGNMQDTLLHVLILSIIVAFGGGLIYKGVKLLADMPNMLVKQVDVTNIVSENHTFFYRAEFKMPLNGKYKTMDAPVAFGDVRTIRSTGKAMLYYVPDKSYMLGRCEEELNEKNDSLDTSLPKSEKLMDMDDKQRLAVLSKIKTTAWKEILKSVLVPCLFGIVLYLVLPLINGSSQSADSYIMVSCFASIVMFLNYIEWFVKNISRLLHIKELKKDHIYWIVVPVTQCTRSVNIFERWYRYAHYIFGGRSHKDWMIIGKYPIDRVTCLVSAKDTSKPYAYMYNWFRGILY